MDAHSIFIGNIEVENKLEVIQKISKSSLYYIKFIDLFNKNIFILKKKPKNENEEDNKK